MPAALFDIWEALAAAVAKTGIRCSAHPVDTINPPMGVLSISNYEYDMTMARGANEQTYTVRVYAGRASERSAAKLIAELMDPANPLNLKYCVEGDNNLLQVVDYARVTSAGDMNVVAIGTGDVLYVTVDFQVEVVVSN